MAACSVTTGGTNGTFRLDFDLAGDHNVLYSTYGDIIWIDDTATNITYTTLTGDVTATSGCVTITALPRNCYLIEYDRWTGDLELIEYISTFDAILKDNTVSTFAIPAQDTIMGSADVVTQVNELGDDTIKIVAAKTENIDTDYMSISFIVRVYGTEIPYLRLKSPYNYYSYLKGTISASCLPTGFVEIPIGDTPAL